MLFYITLAITVGTQFATSDLVTTLHHQLNPKRYLHQRLMTDSCNLVHNVKCYLVTAFEPHVRL